MSIKFAWKPTRTRNGWVWLRFYKCYDSLKFKLLSDKRYDRGERIEIGSESEGY